jgi:protein-tyrosine sulfotransferase
MTFARFAAPDAASFPAPLPSRLEAIGPPSPPIFVGGAGRSGTTLLRVMLDSHSRISCGPELKVLPSVASLWVDLRTRWASTLADSHVRDADVDRAFGRLITSLLEPQRQATGKVRVAEKSPNNVFVFGHLHRMFPDAAFVHMVRDGRDVVASLLSMDWTTTDGTPIAYTRDARLAARYWASAVNAARAFAQSATDPVHFHEMRYEDLVTDPEDTLRALFAFLGEPWEPAVLAYHEVPHDLGHESSAAQVVHPITPTSAGRWQRELSAPDRQAVKEEIGDLLLQLGYARDYAW